MEELPEDIILVIISYIGAEDIYSVSLGSKKMSKIFSSNSCWTELGKRDHPFLGITSREEYKGKNPMHVSRKDLDNYISQSEWAMDWLNKKRINPNGVEDHRYRACVESIGADIIRITNYKSLKKIFPNAEMDWKIGINIIVDDLLTRTEETEKELKSI